MPEIIDQLADLTGLRDRDTLDVSLALALRDLLRPVRVAVHRTTGDAGDERWLTRARLTADDLTATADSVWSDVSQLPRLDDRPSWRQCLESGVLMLLPGDELVTLLPMQSEGGSPGVVELVTSAPLSEELLRLVTGVLRIYRNVQSLLDYSERDTLTGLLNRKSFDESFYKLAATQAASIAAASALAPVPASPAPPSQPALQPPEALPAEAAVAADGVAADADAVAEPVQPASRQGKRRLVDPPQYWLGVIDIDHFKSVNDRFGHLIGDEVLLLLSRVMRASFRFHDRLYRFGGEEFVVLLRCANEVDAMAALERFRRAVRDYPFPQVQRITVSIGFTDVRPGDTPNAAVERADRAVYHAKNHGRDQTHCQATLVAQGLLGDADRGSDMELF